jgi:hypothetical protein
LGQFWIESGQQSQGKNGRTSGTSLRRRIHAILKTGVKMSKLVVAGDQQTWKFMVELKEVFSDEYGWVLPMPGD